jgi:hypothetical protein
MNFRTDTTKGGYKILSIHGPDANGWYAGVLEKAGDIGTVTWNQHGNSTGDMRDLDLIPLADEPEPSETTELWNEIEALREITVETLKRMNEMRTDYIARINGLRSDYLADQSAVQPSRVDALEDRLDNLVAHHKLTESFAADIWQRLDKFDDELGVLQDDVNLDLRLELRDLTKRLEALEQFKRATLAIREAVEQRTQTDEKGVWVTRESLKYAFDATQEFIMRNDRFKEIAERLGLEEDV